MAFFTNQNVNSNRKANVAVIVRSLKVGGMERAACNMCDAFSEAGHHAHLIYLREKDKLIAPRHSDVQVHSWPLQKLFRYTFLGLIVDIVARVINGFFPGVYNIIMGWPLFLIYRAKLFLLERKIGRFDLILIRGQGTFELIWPEKSARAFKICVSVAPKKVDNKFYYRLLFNNSRVICISDNTMVDYLSLFNSVGARVKSIDIVRNVFPINAIRSLMAQSDKDIPKEPYIVSVGRLVPGKNNSLLIDAYNVLKSKYNIKQKLYILGEGSDRGMLERKVNELGLSSEVHFVGYKKNPYPWFKSASLFVLSSKSEGLGGVILEALACSTPITVTNSRGGIHDIMDDFLDEYICDFTPTDMALKMFHALETDSDLLIYDKILSRYSADTVVNDWFQLI